MSDPKRLSIASASDLERLLLQSGRASAPTAARHRAIVAATAALGTTVVTTASAAASGLAAKAASLLSFPWVAVVSLAGISATAVTVTAAVLVHQPRSEAPRLVAPTGAAASKRADLAARPEPPPAPPASTSVDTATAEKTSPATVMPALVLRRVPSARAASSSTETSVHAELATLEQAQKALASGEPARALSLLDAYSSSFPQGVMALEATVLRIEALARAGDRTAAQRVGDAFVASHPESPYASRIRSLVGESNPCPNQ